MQLSEKLTKEIFIKYPKIWNEIEKQYDKNPIGNVNSYQNLYVEIRDNGEINFISDLLRRTIPFSMLYGLLRDFFEEYDIIIDTYLDVISKGKINKFYYRVSRNNLIITHELNNSRQEAQYQAILKACEIKENTDEKQ